MTTGPTGDDVARFTLTPEDGGRAQLALWQAVWTTPARFLLGVVIFSACFGVLTLAARPSMGGLHLAIRSLEVGVLFEVVFLAACLLIAPWYGRRGLRKLRTIAGEFTCRSDDEKLVITHPNGASNVPWPLFHSWVDAADVLLIRVSPYNFVLLPKSAFDADQLGDVARRLRRAGVLEVPRFGVIRSGLGRPVPRR